MNHIVINGRQIGPGCPTYIVAEMSANHNQDFDQAVKIIEAAKEAGADAIKLQTAKPGNLTLNSDRPEFVVPEGSLWAGQTLYDLYQQTYTPWEWQPKLKALAEEMGLDCFSSPFSPEAVDFLQSIDVPAFKVASFELVDIPLIEYIARQGKPIIMSTGLSVLSEVDEAVRAARKAGNDQIALLKCNSAYPAPPEQMNLRTIPHLHEMYNLPVGLSDHTLGSVVAIAAVSLGACIIEKHLTLSRAVPSPDSAFSMEPHEFKEMVEQIRIVEEALGAVTYEPTSEELASRVFRRSLFVVRDIAKGERFTKDNVRSIRPGHGLPPKHLSDVLGLRAAYDIKRSTPLDWHLIAGDLAGINEVGG